MENYEKKYKKALERARVYHTGGSISDAHITEVIFPELKESDDERMLREIKRYIQEQGDKPTGLPNGTVPVSDMIAWLEKQGEQTHAELSQQEVTKTSDQELSDKIDVRTMAAWQSGYNEGIEKACEWLRTNLCEHYADEPIAHKMGRPISGYISFFEEPPVAVIGDFHKAMKGGNQ